MLTNTEAFELVTRRLGEMSPPDDSWVVIEAHTIEKPYGWVFYFDSKRHTETGELSDALAGNGSVIVNKHDGSVTFLGPLQSIAEYDERDAR